MSNKTENLILLICDRLKDEETFGSTVLNKVLYYVDNISYLKTGKPISDFTYIKQNQGPTPNPKMFLAVREHLRNNGKLDIVERNHFGRVQQRPTPKVNPILSEFTPEEISLIDDVIKHFGCKNATEVSNISHETIAWNIARSMEELPFYSYLLTQEELHESDIVWARTVLSAN